MARGPRRGVNKPKYDEQRRNNGPNAGNGGNNYRDYRRRGGNNGHFRGFGFNNNNNNWRHQHEATERDQNCGKMFNSESGIYNSESNFPKFKDDNSNISMPQHNNRTNFEKVSPIMENFRFQPDPEKNTVINFTNQQNESNQKDIQNETKKQEIQIPNNLIEEDKGKNIAPNLIINIKKEKISSPEKKLKQKSDSSSSDSSSDSSDTMEKLKKAIKNDAKLSKKLEEKQLLPKPKIIKKEPGIKDSSSSSSTSSSSDSDDDISSAKKIKKKKKCEKEEVICLGKLEKIENLIDDEDTNKNNCCILCDKMDHKSFHCQMICKNCGAQYHNLKSCTKPANLSMMLQYFLEFCLNQCTIYNPEQRFSFRNGNVQTELLPARNINENINNFNIPNENVGSTKSKRIHLKSQTENMNSKLNTSLKKKNQSDSEQDISTDSSSSLGTSSTKRKRKRQKLTTPTTQNNTTSTSYPPTGMGFSSPYGFNPMMAAAFSQMMGFNPAAAMNFTSNKNMEK